MKYFKIFPITSHRDLKMLFESDWEIQWSLVIKQSRFGECQKTFRHLLIILANWRWKFRKIEARFRV